MSLKGVSIPLILTVAAAIFVLLFAGSFILERAHALTPLQEALEEHPDVAEYEIERNDLWTVTVSLHRVDRFKEAYHDIQSTILQILEPESFELVIQGQPDALVLQWWDQVELTVYEAAATGKFSRIVSAGQQYRPADEGIYMDVQADGEYIYIQMISEEGHLYRHIFHGLSSKQREEGG